MNEVFEKAPAKLNFFLDITGKREDGFHLLQTMMHTVSLCDRITLKQSDTVSLRCNRSDLPLGKGNLAYDAAVLFCKKTGCSGSEILLEKVIPSGAGLGGGSSDAAAVLRGLNRLYATGLSDEELLSIALCLGADVPFFIKGGCAFVTGIGERLLPLAPLQEYLFLICKPSFDICTKDAYRAYDRLVSPNHFSADRLLAHYQEGRMEAFWSGIQNVLTEATDQPEIVNIQQQLLQNGAAASCMTGSGSAVFGVFEREETAQRAASFLKPLYPQTYLCFPTCIK